MNTNISTYKIVMLWALLCFAFESFSLPPLIPFRKADKWGYVNQKGEIIVPLVYDYVSQLENGYGELSLNKKFAIIDSTGKLLTDLIYESDRDFLVMSENIAWVRKYNNAIILTSDGKEIIPQFQYQAYESFHNGFAVVKRNNKFGFVNKKGKEIIPCIYDSCKYASYNRSFCVKSAGKWGYIDVHNKVIGDFKFFKTYEFIKGIAIVTEENGKEGFINEQGEIVRSLRYENIWPIDKGYYGFELNGKQGILNSKGKIFLLAKYDKVDASGKNIFVVAIGSLNEIFNTKLKRIYFSNRFRHINTFSEGFAAVETLNGKFGFINKKGALIIDTLFKNANWFFEGLANVNIAWDKEGYINKKGEIVIPCIYGNTDFFRDGLAVVRRNDKWFYIDKKGKEYIDWD
ncbi:MAG: WG repeat-containing protein [Ferruginibacter sp.]